jgi:hypothetical protein
MNLADYMTDEAVGRWVRNRIKQAADTGDLDHARLLEFRMASNDPERWYHGGFPGLSMGSTVQPPTVTDYVSAATMIRDVKLEPLYHLASATYDPSFVYITHNRALARDHAAGWSNWNYIQTGIREPGKLYTVTPTSLVIPDFVPPVCCCYTHGPETPCCAKVRSAVVDYVDDEQILPILSPGWLSTIDVLGQVYNVWKGRRHDDFIRSRRRGASVTTPADMLVDMHVG